MLTSARIHAAHGVDSPWATFDPVTIQFLSRLPDVEFVVSSTWRRIFDQRGVHHILRAAGFIGKFHQCWQTPHVVSITDANHAWSSRAREIDAWLRDHLGERDFVVLDDDGGPWPEDWKVVQTSAFEGMLTEHYDALKIQLRKGRTYRR